MRKALLLVILMAIPAMAQVTYAPMVNAKVQFLDSLGHPLSGGKLYTYSAGTSTAKNTYSDSSGTPNPNPVILDSGGYATIYLGQFAYKFVLKTSADVTVWTVDNITSVSLAAYINTTNTFTAAQTDSALHTFSAGITGTGNTGALTLGSGALAGAYTWGAAQIWSAAQTDNALHTFNAGIKVGSAGSTISDTREIFQSVHYCGSTGTCSNTANIQATFVFGTITLSGGTATLTVPAANNLISCGCSDLTTTNGCHGVQASSTTVTFTGNATDTVRFECVSY